MIKATIQKEEITLVNQYGPNIGTYRNIKQISIDIKREVDSNRKTVGNFNTLHSEVDRCYIVLRESSKKQQLKCTLDQMDLAEFYRNFHLELQNTPSSQQHMEHHPGQIT